MRAVTYSEFGDPSRVLALVEKDLPIPSPGQIRVKLVMSPIHNHNLMTIAGVYGTKPELPSFPGTEAVGIIDAVGDGVIKFNVGQRVIGGAARPGRTTTLPMRIAR